MLPKRVGKLYAFTSTRPKQQLVYIDMGIALQREAVRHHRFDQRQLKPTRPRAGCKGAAERRTPRCQLILQSQSRTTVTCMLIVVLVSTMAAVKGFQGQSSAFAYASTHTPFKDCMQTAERSHGTVHAPLPPRETLCTQAPLQQHLSPAAGPARNHPAAAPARSSCP